MGSDIAASGDALAADAEGVSERGEIRSDERSGDVALVVEKFLPLANHAEEAVVDDGDVDLDFFLNDGRELAHGHLEATVADDDPDFGVGLGKFGADGGGQTRSPWCRGRRK